MPVIYHFSGDRIWTKRVHEITQDRYGLWSGRVIFETIPDLVMQRLRATRKYDSHPLFNWLEMERVSMRPNGAFVELDAEYFGISGNDSEPVYEMANAAGEFPIEHHPNFPEIVKAAGLTPDKYLDEDGKFKGFPAQKLPEGGDGHDYPEGRNLAGVESYMGYGEVIWRCVHNTRTRPSQDQIEAVGKIQTPEGNPPTPQGRNWILAAHPFTQRGKTYQVTREWKLSGPFGANPEVYGPNSKL